MQNFSLSDIQWLRQATQLVGNYYAKREEHSKCNQYKILEHKLESMISKRRTK